MARAGRWFRSSIRPENPCKVSAPSGAIEGVTRFFRRGDELEERLRGFRAEPRPEFLRSIVERAEGRTWGGILRATLRIRVAAAAALTVSAVALFGTLGGIGYASSAAHSFVQTVGQGSTLGQDRDVRPSDDQYDDDIPICHWTGSLMSPFVITLVRSSGLVHPYGDRHPSDTFVGLRGHCPGADFD